MLGILMARDYVIAIYNCTPNCRQMGLVGMHSTKHRAIHLVGCKNISSCDVFSDYIHAPCEGMADITWSVSSTESPHTTCINRRGLYTDRVTQLPGLTGP